MKSIWCEEQKEIEKKPALHGDITTDVLIVGGGMAGVLTAYFLKRAGVDCVLMEKGRIAGGNTCNTTAKITAQHGAIYSSLIQKFGAYKGRQYYNINTRAIEEYRQLAKKIPCDFEEKTAFIYSASNKNALKEEIKAYQRLRIPWVWQDNPPLPLPGAEALGMENQAQFHPLKLMRGLCEEIKYYEGTQVIDIEGNKAFTKEGSVTAQAIVFCTHYPMVNVPGLYFMKLTQERSYVLALEENLDLGGMYIDEAKFGYSFRNYGGKLLLGGGGRKTGCDCGGFEELRGFAKKAYPTATEAYHWSAQDCMTLDQVPYIGLHRRGAAQVYVATGFNKWGMTGSMSAALVLRDLICTGKSEYEELFSPQRPMWSTALIANVATSAFHLLHFGKRCAHLGCALKWNSRERCWECPCHGSRFDEGGGVLDNPAKRGISVER